MSLETLKRVIRNQFYYGLFKWKEKLYKGNHDAIVSKDLWDKVLFSVVKGIYIPKNITNVLQTAINAIAGQAIVYKTE